MTVRECTTQMRRRLEPVFGAGETRAMIRVIFSFVKGWNTVQLFMNEGKELSDWALHQVQDITDRMLLGEPLQYITGIAPFCGMDLHVEPGVLIPRPETEQLADLIIDRYKGSSDLEILDIGTGSGCLAIALQRALLFPHVTAIDLSAKALEIARGNAKMLKAPVHFDRADLYDYFPQPDSLDIVVSNPPYIHPDEAAAMERNVLDHEPHEALFVKDSAAPEGVYRRIAEIAARGLKPGGTLWLEINPLYVCQTAEAVSSNLSQVEVIKDIHGRDRFLTATKPAQP